MTLQVYPDYTSDEFWLNVQRGNVPGASVVHKFGRNAAVTTMAPIAFGGVYQTPQPASATTLRVKAGNTNDTAAGSGAREITIQDANKEINKILRKIQPPEKGSQKKKAK